MQICAAILSTDHWPISTAMKYNGFVQLKSFGLAVGSERTA